MHGSGVGLVPLALVVLRLWLPTAGDLTRRRAWKQPLHTRCRPFGIEPSPSRTVMKLLLHAMQKI